MFALLFQLSQNPPPLQIATEPIWEQLAQLAFWGSIVFLMVGLPIFILLWFRLCRDLHRISESLHWIAHCTRAPEQPEQAARPHVANSAFGR